MDSNKLHDWLQIIGMFAVVASLLFVAFEVRQAHKISLSQAYQSRTSLAVEYHLAFGANPTTLSAWSKSTEDLDSMTLEERGALRRQLFALYYMYDNIHYQYQQGFVSDEYWAVTQESMKGVMSNAFAHAVFLERLDVAGRNDFKEVIARVSNELRQQDPE